MECEDKREAQFLEARALRLQNNAKASQTRKRGEELQAFRARYRQEVNTWQHRLETLIAGEHKGRDAEENKERTEASLAERRTNLRVSMAELQADLDALRKHSLSTASSGGAAQFEDWDVPASIPPADLRLLHTELTKCASQLDEARDSLLPKAKFVFHRYRRARLLQAQAQQQKQSSEQNDVGASLQQTVSNSHSLLVQFKGPLEDLNYRSIHVSPDGTVAIQVVVNADSITDANQTGQEEAPTSLSVAGESSLVIRNVHHSTIVLQNNVKELHISKVSNSTIIANADALSGATMHVTGCQNVKLLVQSYHQLRIHDSSNLHFQIHNAKASGGTILEDCTNLVFSVVVVSSSNDSGRSSSRTGASEEDSSKHLDIKDFNWLRNGVPSPNFRVQTERRKEQQDDKEIGSDLEVSRATKCANEDPIRPPTIDTPVDSAAGIVSQTEDSDDDEL